MPYITDRIVHDADAHIMETADWLAGFAPDRIKRHLLGFDGTPSVASTAAELETILSKQNDAAYRARDEDGIMLRKNWAATGALYKQDRPRALDLMQRARVRRDLRRA